MSDSLSTAWAARKAARGASRSCNPETEFTAGWEARDAEVDALRELKQRDYDWMLERVTAVAAERDAALAMIERVLDLTGDIGPEARRILTQSPTVVLAEHDRAVVKAALHGFADRLSGDYALDHSSPTALLGHIVGLARRDGGAG